MTQSHYMPTDSDIKEEDELIEFQQKRLIDKINRVIMACLNSPNKSTQRAALWCRLIKLRATLVN